MEMVEEPSVRAEEQVAEGELIDLLCHVEQLVDPIDLFSRR